MHNPTRFDLRQISGRNQDKGTKSTGEIKEKSTVNSATSVTHFHNSVMVPSNRMAEKTNSMAPTDHEIIMEAIGEEFPPVENPSINQDSQLTYKVITGASHQKSQSFGGSVNSQGIYNMYMG